jgi:hypothetical protein
MTLNDVVDRLDSLILKFDTFLMSILIIVI